MFDDWISRLIALAGGVAVIASAVVVLRGSLARVRSELRTVCAGGSGTPGHPNLRDSIVTRRIRMRAGLLYTALIGVATSLMCLGAAARFVSQSSDFGLSGRIGVAGLCACAAGCLAFAYLTFLCEVWLRRGERGGSNPQRGSKGAIGRQADVRKLTTAPRRRGAE